MTSEDISRHDDYWFITQIEGEWRTWNVILLFAESFSFVDSKLAWWYYDNLPAFDRIAKEWILFTNFMSNGCTSDAWHLSTLMGTRPWNSDISSWWQYVQEFYPFTGLATVFNQQWYKSIFISSAPLEFLNQEDFLVQAWFSKIYGQDHFRNEPKYVFDSAPDASVYKIIIDELKNSWDAPMFIGAQTISTHLPYDTPYWKTKIQSWKYANDALNTFYDDLLAINFFSSWTLVIVWDHRKFDDIDKQERSDRWQGLYGKTVWAIVGPWIQSSQYNKPVQHIDIHHQLQQLYSEETVTIPTIINSPFTKNKQIQWRDWTIRYCSYIDNRLHVVTNNDQFYLLDRPNHISYRYAQTILQAKDITSNSINTNTPIQLVWYKWWAKWWQNSMKGIREVADLWISAIEIDVAMTIDGSILLTDGNTDNLTCKNNNTIATKTYQRIQENCLTQDEEPIQTIDEALSKMAWLYDVIFLELKIYKDQDIEHYVDEIVEAINVSNMNTKVITISNDAQTRLQLSSYENIKVGYDSFTSDNSYNIWKTEYTHFLTEKTHYTAEQVASMQNLGKIFVVYTLSTKEELEEAIQKWVDMVIVDDIEIFQERLSEIEKMK